MWSEPPDASGDESLHFVSGRRRVKLKGHSFREFERRVIPLLDGQNTLEEIGRNVEDVFAIEDLEAGLDLLASQNLLEDGPIEEADADAAARLLPQYNFFQEIGLDAAEIQRQLRRATVTVLGLSGAGANLVDALAASGVGTIRCVDGSIVSPADIYLSSGFCTTDVGSTRISVTERRVSGRSPETKLETLSSDLSSDEAVTDTIEGSDFVVCCLDLGQSSLIYKLNRACLKTDTRWTSCTLSGSEVIVGPTIHPRVTPCYLCYKMRVVACAGNPEDAFAFEKVLDRRKQDDSSNRENLVFGAGLAANMLALETLREVAGLTPVPTLGKLVIFDLLDMSSSKHVVLRKPWCPACFPMGSKSAAVPDELSHQSKPR
ncbi:TOMM precursor leader peptide-binding protein [Alloacidobacterium sp.]|uniref:TOMM precursor leader peptide-binding protein n=1 Tax=Alloacidobacterium sp. TaxID=2951999 RepID=UPI002D6E3629|nr:TOMM precursor leader peptide-binding protein [Alloacidobacterium sp.]HYK37780.1 TOMM precursor leader peptide-binding protein [Alloacidobacterium sp.]